MNAAKRISDAVNDVDVVLLLNEQNRRYASGLGTSDGAVLLTANDRIFITDSRYTEIARKTCTGFTVIEQREQLSKEIAACVASLGAKSVGFEEDYVTVSLYNRLSSLMNTEFAGISSHIAALRSIKTDEEIELIRSAQKITDAAFSDIVGFIAPGRTERQVAAYLEYCMKQHGSDNPAFDTIAVSGPNTSLPHGEPTDKPIKNGEFVTLDFGAKFRGYRSDMTRTVCVGQPDEKMTEIYDIVLEANLTALAGIKSGITGRRGDAYARSVIADAGYGDCFGHGLGHGVGLDIHESPSFSPRCNDIIKENTVISVEPGIYLENRFGVRIEDLVVIKNDGVDNLTASPKELMIL